MPFIIFIKNYEQYASISQTVSKGSYDCVTATALYSLFLTELEIPFAVVETNYHIYLLVYPETDKEVLLETTDPLAGFITNKQIIAERKLQYKQGNNEVSANQAVFNWDIETTLKGQELTGVLLYNQSVKQFNLGNNTEAKKLAKEALQHYNSNRISSYLNFLEENQIASN